jgi:hypothetical protein
MNSIHMPLKFTMNHLYPNFGEYLSLCGVIGIVLYELQSRHVPPHDIA